MNSHEDLTPNSPYFFFSSRSLSRLLMLFIYSFRCLVRAVFAVALGLACLPLVLMFFNRMRTEIPSNPNSSTRLLRINLR